jgi:hypothetical protein
MHTASQSLAGQALPRGLWPPSKRAKLFLCGWAELQAEPVHTLAGLQAAQLGWRSIKL